MFEINTVKAKGVPEVRPLMQPLFFCLHMRYEISFRGR